MKLVTWNVNSVRVRLPRLMAMLDRHRPEIVCLQELKCVDEQFPRAPLIEIGYQLETFGQKTYNGVAILARGPIENVVRGMQDGDPDTAARMIAGTVRGVRVVNVYVPNGQEVGSEKFIYKLRWLERLETWLRGWAAPMDSLVMCGDFNVAPEDRDVGFPDKWRGQVLFHPDEHARLGQICGFGLVDALRLHSQEAGLHTWWDYRGGAFHKGDGLRIDLVLVSQPMAERCESVEIDREERKGEGPSDHAPVVVTFRDPQGGTTRRSRRETVPAGN